MRLRSSLLLRSILNVFRMQDPQNPWPSPPLSESGVETPPDKPFPALVIASLSLGNNLYHSLPHKIEVAAKHGYDGIELFIVDFEAFIREVGIGMHRDLLGRFPAPFPSTLPVTPSDPIEALELRCAQVIGDYCLSLDLSVPILQPFRDFENFFEPGTGNDSSSALLNVALARAERLFKWMPLLRTDLLLVSSNHLPYDPFALPWCAPKPPSTPSPSQTLASPPSPLKPTSTPYAHPYWHGKESYVQDMVRAFHALGELAEKYSVRVGYEALAWGTVVNRWEQVWDVVCQVNRPNVGIILDSFNQLAKQSADPATSTGLRIPLPSIQDHISFLLHTLKSHPDKLFFYQVATAAPPKTPIRSTPNIPKRMKWSRTSRLFPGETDHLPVKEFSEAILASGYKGPWSVEVFNDSLNDEGSDVVESHARRGIIGLRSLWQTVAALP